MRFSRALLLILPFVVAVLLLSSAPASWAQKAKPPQPPPPPPDPAIAYTAWNRSNLWVNLYVMNADGTNQSMILSGAEGIGHHSPSWSPDGWRLAFTSNIQGNGVYIVNRDGSGLCKVVAMNSYPSDTGVRASWSPLGDKIVYSDRNPENGYADLFLVDAACNAGAPILLTSTPDVKEYFPTWSPDATHIAVQAMNTETSQTSIVVFDLAYDPLLGIVITGSTNVTEAGPLSAAFVRDPSWAKTSDKIAVPAWFGGLGFYDIWVIELADPTYPINLTNTPPSRKASITNSYWPTWSPDDARLAFYRGGKDPGIYVMNADGSGATKLASLQNGGETDWRRNP